MVTIMKRFFIAMTALSMTLGAAGVAFAHEAGEQREKPVFPMKADEFQKRIDGKVSKMRERLEHRLTEKQVPADKAKEIRARFESNVTQLTDATKKATADGVVTADEAKEVRAVMHAMHPHHKRGEGKKNDGGSKS